jgi:hypothetical protein
VEVQEGQSHIGDVVEIGRHPFNIRTLGIDIIEHSDRASN